MIIKQPPSWTPLCERVCVCVGVLVFRPVLLLRFLRPSRDDIADVVSRFDETTGFVNASQASSAGGTPVKTPLKPKVTPLKESVSSAAAASPKEIGVASSSKSKSSPKEVAASSSSHAASVMGVFSEDPPPAKLKKDGDKKEKKHHKDKSKKGKSAKAKKAY